VRSESDQEWLDELRAKNCLLEAELRKALTDVARAERERDEARHEVRSLRAVGEARWSWSR
jgi:hypothetical protein